MSKYDFPEILETSRFILEASSEKHAERAYNLIDSCRDYLGEFIEWAYDFSLDNAMKSYSQKAESFAKKQAFDYSIIDKQTNKFLGSISLIIKQNGVVSVGFWLDETEQGRGVISESLNMLIDFSFNNTTIEKILLQANIDNIKSQKVAEKAGFVFEGLFYTYRLNIYGESVDMYNYAILKDKEKMNKLKSIQQQLKQIYKVKN